jgi:hypothetical protein
VNSVSGLYHEALSAEDIAKVHAVMYRARQHEYQILTKRAWRRKTVFALPEFWALVSQLAGFACAPGDRHHVAIHAITESRIASITKGSSSIARLTVLGASKTTGFESRDYVGDQLGFWQLPRLLA